jgi:plastocyanin
MVLVTHGTVLLSCGSATTCYWITTLELLDLTCSPFNEIRGNRRWLRHIAGLANDSPLRIQMPFDLCATNAAFGMSQFRLVWPPTDDRALCPLVTARRSLSCSCTGSTSSIAHTYAASKEKFMHSFQWIRIPSPRESRRHITLRVPLAVSATIVLLALVLAACSSGSSSSGNSNSSTITMGSGVFSGNTSITIKAGDTVTFDDSAGGPHDLVIGTGGQFTAASGAPSDLNSAGGVTFQGGDKKTIVFSNAGTFHITCTIHPSMAATVIVTP